MAIIYTKTLANQKFKITAYSKKGALEHLQRVTEKVKLTITIAVLRLPIKFNDAGLQYFVYLTKRITKSQLILYCS